jgi:DUF2924 family protein
MTPAQLRAAWRECWRKPAPDIGPDLLRRGIAWKLQSRVHGELPSAARRLTQSGLARLRRGEEIGVTPAVQLKPGTRLVREWHGKTHHVIVLENGFEHEGRRYSSLTQIASSIAGVHWSGPSFFGLKKRRSVNRRAAA